jgi:signal transduction histidine kinase
VSEEAKPQGSQQIAEHSRLAIAFPRLCDIIREMVATLDLRTLLGHIVQAAKELTSSQAASLLLYDSEAKHLYLEASTERPGESPGKVAVPAERSVAGWVFLRGKPLHVEDTLHDTRFFPEVDAITGLATRSVIAAPLHSKEQTIGVLEAINKPNGYISEDLDLLQILAAQASIAIENNRLFQQSDLVSEMVHELRTPLGALTAAGHLLQRPELDQEQRLRLAGTILEEVRRLNTMTGNFLELSRLESGRTRLTFEPVHLGGLVEECLEIIRPQAEMESIVLKSDVDRSMATVRGDRNHLKQLLLNLLTNAVKYNRSGGRIRVRVYPQNKEIIIAVSDTGRGIPECSLPHIFERFYRVPDEEGYSLGTGLGLAIAKRIAESHGGRIEVESEEGKGTTFFVRLPSGAAQLRG